MTRYMSYPSGLVLPLSPQCHSLRSPVHDTDKAENPRNTIPITLTSVLNSFVLWISVTPLGRTLILNEFNHSSLLDLGSNDVLEKNLSIRYTVSSINTCSPSWLTYKYYNIQFLTIQTIILGSLKFK